MWHLVALLSTCVPSSQNLCLPGAVCAPPRPLLPPPTLPLPAPAVVQVRFKNELERNITIKLGYANAKIYKCADPRCPRPACYKAYGSSKEDTPKCDVPGATRRGRVAGSGVRCQLQGMHKVRQPLR